MKIVVLMGGLSDEREVSLASGAQVANALREAGHEALAVDTVAGALDEAEERRLLAGGVGRSPPAGDRLARLSNARVSQLALAPPTHDADVFFLALHGGAGEDGSIQGLLDTAGVAYTGSDRLGCSLAMDKEVTKRLLREAGAPTPDWRLLDECSDMEIERALGLPVIVKAANGGSSLRLTLAKDREQLALVRRESRSWNDVVICERYHPGREFTVGVVGGDLLPVGEIVPKREYFDYISKYQTGMAEEIFPAGIDDGLATRLQELALDVFQALRMRDYGRVDFMVDGEDRPWCLEANASPGMTANSLLPKAAAAAGIGFPDLCDRLARLAAERG